MRHTDTLKRLNSVIQNHHNDCCVCACAIHTGYVYSPFGAITASWEITEDFNPFLFSSEFHDPELGLSYYNYRHYNPTDGRWLSRDPIEERGGWNLYGFILNNVINFIDLLGNNSTSTTSNDSKPEDKKDDESNPLVDLIASVLPEGIPPGLQNLLGSLSTMLDGPGKYDAYKNLLAVALKKAKQIIKQKGCTTNEFDALLMVDINLAAAKCGGADAAIIAPLLINILRQLKNALQEECKNKKGKK